MIHYDSDFDIAAEVVADSHRWIAARGTLYANPSYPTTWQSEINKRFSSVRD